MRNFRVVVIGSKLVATASWGQSFALLVVTGRLYPPSARLLPQFCSSLTKLYVIRNPSTDGGSKGLFDTKQRELLPRSQEQLAFTRVERDFKLVEEIQTE